MDIDEFERALEYNDFAVGDTFWIGKIKFEIIENNEVGIK